jgi:hypothetical protein
LKPPNSRKLNHSLKRVIAQFTVEGRVDSSGVQVPSKAGSHGNTSVLELRLPVIFHLGIRFSGRETKGVEESDRGCDSNLVVDPGIEFGLSGAGRFGGSKGSTVVQRIAYLLAKIRIKNKRNRQHEG